MFPILLLSLVVSGSARPPVQTGLDRLFDQMGDGLKGKRIGVITDHTGVDARDGGPFRAGLE